MIPLVNAYANERWAMDPEALEAFLAAAAAINPEFVAKLSIEGKSPEASGLSVMDGTATIPVAGTLLKSVPPILRAFGFDATGYDEVSEAIDQANARDDVARIVLAVDSPGGQVSGVQALADKIHSNTKPVTAHISELGASAAYWLASQADEITAGRSAKVGSIGVYSVVYDRSAQAAKEGIKVHVVASGPFKGAGVPGSTVTEDQLSALQASIDADAASFIEDVARGRGVSPTAIKESADGKVYNTGDALSRGLIDRISADPEKDRKMSDALKFVAALVKEFPAHAAVITDQAAAGKPEADIRAALEKAQAKAEHDAVVKDRDEKAEALKAAVAATEAKDKALAEANAKLAEISAKYEALAALKDGAKAGNKVKPDGDESKPLQATQAEYDAMDLSGKSDFWAKGGKIQG